jgi:hypothetical protein
MGKVVGGLLKWAGIIALCIMFPWLIPVFVILLGMALAAD